MNQTEIEVTVECVKLLDGLGYDVRLVKGDDIVRVCRSEYSNLAINYAESIARITGFEMYLVREVVTTVVASPERF